ncbi:MAG: hypothetical protein J6R86_02255, partial [Lentisphaeria bacterium]|nr:hypothetical protein [Lentisphaeria bacterium]
EKQLKQIGYTDIKFQKAQTADKVEYLAISAISGKNSLGAMIAIYKDGWIFKDKKVSVLEIYGPTESMKKIDFNKFYESFKF